MIESFVFSTMLAVLTLLMVASFVALLSKKIPLPYSVLLVLAGSFFGLMINDVPSLQFLADFHLSPDMVFYIFLPTLIFESAYHLDILHFRRSIKPIILLSTFTFAISTLVIGYSTSFLFEIPILVALLFGSIVSSTDPVAVIAIFRQIGAPPRLTTIVEGESLLNDGMSLVTFGILIELIRTSTGITGLATIGSFLFQFIYVVVGGSILGIILGYLFSTLIANVKNSRHIEITLTIILAHTTFLIAEQLLGVSGILSTMIAGMVIGNYGRHKISPLVKEFMHNFWDFAAFISNSLIFLLVGKEITGLIVNSEQFNITTIITITLVAMAARAISVYITMPLINSNKKNRIPGTWAHILQWGGIRGALALALLLSLPENFPQRDLIVLLGLTIVMMSLIINGNTIKLLIKKLNLNKFSLVDTFEKHECKVVIDQNILSKLKTYHEKRFISDKTYQKIKSYYQDDENRESQIITKLLAKQQQDDNTQYLYLILKNHFLGIERQVFQKLYARGEITERLLQILLTNVDEQIEKLDSATKVHLAPLFLLESENRLLKKFQHLEIVSDFIAKRKHDEITLRFEMYRARGIAINKVLRLLDKLCENREFCSLPETQKLKQRYQTWREKAEQKNAEIKKKHPKIAANTELYLMQKFCLKTEAAEIQQLREAGILSAKVAQSLLADIQERKHDNYKLICHRRHAQNHNQ